MEKIIQANETTPSADTTPVWLTIALIILLAVVSIIIIYTILLSSKPTYFITKDVDCFDEYIDGIQVCNNVDSTYLIMNRCNVIEKNSNKCVSFNQDVNITMIDKELTKEWLFTYCDCLQFPDGYGFDRFGSPQQSKSYKEAMNKCLVWQCGEYKVWQD